MEFFDTGETLDLLREFGPDGEVALAYRISGLIPESLVVATREDVDDALPRDEGRVGDH